MLLLRILSMGAILCSFAYTAIAADTGLAINTTDIIAYGDDLTAGAHVAKGRGYPASLERELHMMGHFDIRIINEGRSNFNSHYALKHINIITRKQPRIVLLQVGYNDILQKQTANKIYYNIAKAINIFGKNKIGVILIGTSPPDNYPEEYKKKINGMYQYIAKKHKVPLYPDFFKVLENHPEYYNEDGLLPNQRGYKAISSDLAQFIQRTIYKR